ncbi:MAG: histidine kinase N-terminal 7TM domain-containing protein, partial [Halobacteria archaeon]|nr:histidine kinase N-terminal 7TM domain-containing protein [Halobacteria archaeon]
MKPFQYTSYTVPLLLAAFVSLLTAYVAWKRGDSKTEKWFSAFMVLEMLWALLILLTVSVTSYKTKLLVYKIFLPISVTVTVPLLIYTCHYTGRKHLVTKPLLVFLGGIIVSAYGAVIFFPELVIYNTYLDTSGSFAQLEYTRGIIFWLYGAVAFSIVSVTLGMQFLKFLRSRNIYRKIIFFMFMSTLILSTLAFISFVGLSPYPLFMLNPFGILVFGIVSILVMTSKRFVQMIPVEWILSRLSSKFESLIPVARDFVVEEIDNGVIVLDNSGRIVDINSKAKNILRAERAVGKKITELIDPQMVYESAEIIESLKRNEIQEMDGDIRVEYPDGEKYYNINVSKLSIGGNESGSVVLIHDITKQKEREWKLKEREQKLEQQKRNLEQQNQRLDKFASIVSHDLRNPLNVAQGYVEMGLENPSKEKFKEVDESLDRMEKIIDDALTLARQGKAITDMEGIHLADVTREAWENVDTNDVNLEVELDAETVIEGDYNRLLNVFENLFRNSVEHGDNGKDLTVRVGETPSGFYVEDDGSGIPDDEKENIF